MLRSGTVGGVVGNFCFVFSPIMAESGTRGGWISTILPDQKVQHNYGSTTVLFMSCLSAADLYLTYLIYITSSPAPRSKISLAGIEKGDATGRGPPIAPPPPIINAFADARSLFGRARTETGNRIATHTSYDRKIMSVLLMFTRGTISLAQGLELNESSLVSVLIVSIC